MTREKLDYRPSVARQHLLPNLMDDNQLNSAPEMGYDQIDVESRSGFLLRGEIFKKRTELNFQTRIVILPKPVQVSDRPPDRSTRSGRKILTLDHILDHSPDHIPDHIPDPIPDHILDHYF
ncbi:hypothetical protein FHG87_014508 [Trinorchestia longiramus]|nr:hypothetical protein FHG87_014508 [Trinorchestia longiramus]